MIVTRINVGAYEITLPRGTFQVERFPDGSWLLFEMVRGSREYLHDFSTKREAVSYLTMTQLEREGV